jgi:outer membrane protein TolC
VANYRQTVLSAFQAVEDNLANLRILTTETEQRKTAVNSSQFYVDLAMTRFQAGIDSYLNVSTAQTAYLTNEENAVLTQLQLMQASVALVMAMGGGWAASDLP